jgi:predicted  nucleic acid-binding Zn-ribbon protein
MTVDISTILSIIAGTSGIGGILVAISTRRKTKADAMSIVQQAAANQVLRMEEEAQRWKNECTTLRDELEEIRGKVDEQDACQTTLKSQVAQLEREKSALLEEVGKLRNRVDQLEAENRRLKCEVDKAEV